jgi:hypothetical protein
MVAAASIMATRRDFANLELISFLSCGFGMGLTLRDLDGRTRRQIGRPRDGNGEDATVDSDDLPFGARQTDDHFLDGIGRDPDSYEGIRWRLARDNGHNPPRPRIAAPRREQSNDDACTVGARNQIGGSGRGLRQAARTPIRIWRDSPSTNLLRADQIVDLDRRLFAQICDWQSGSRQIRWQPGPARTTDGQRGRREGGQTDRTYDDE